MSLSIIVALTRDNAIGRNGDLLYHLPGDLPRFKALTLGHPVVMGRKTYESLPRRPLPGRRNMVLSRDPDYRPEGAEVYASLPEALAAIGPDDSTPFVIGGGQVYAQALPLADTLYLTVIDDECPDADTFFPHIESEQWIQEQCEAGYTGEPDADTGHPAFFYVTLRRK